MDPCSPRNGKYKAGYYALNVNDRYGKKTQALPSGRKKGVPLVNSVTPSALRDGEVRPAIVPLTLYNR